jgi:hypothetical protein
MGEFIRDRLPDAQSYFEGEDVRLVGPGQWKTGPCHFHGGSDSLRVNVQSGGWCCMACDTKGGNVLDYHMQRHGLGFIEAARDLGAYVDDGKRYAGKATATTLSARDAMTLAAGDLRIAFVVISDVRQGVIPNDADWRSLIECARRLDALATEYGA